MEKISKYFSWKKKLSLFLIGSGISGYYTYQYISKTNPEKLRKIFFDNYFENKHEKNIESRQIVNTKLKTENLITYLNLINFLLRLNLIPAVKNEFDEEKRYKGKYNLLTNINGKEFLHPIGLGCGIDTDSKKAENLDKLGFSFIEYGIISDQDEFEANFIDYSKEKNTFRIIKEPKSTYQSFVPNINKFIFRKISENSKINSLIGAQFKVSEMSQSTVPYLSDNFIVKGFVDSFLITDFLTLNLTSFKSLSNDQYCNPKKFEILLKKLKKAIFIELAIKESLNHETILKKSTEDSKIIMRNIYMSQDSISKTFLPIFILKLNNNLKEENLKKIIDISLESGIVDAFQFGGILKKEKSFIIGEANTSDSLDNLRKAAEIVKGRAPIVSSGGILTGKDVYERIKAGATLVNIFSSFIIRGPFVCEKLLDEFCECMKSDNVFSLEEIRNSNKN